MGLAVLFGLWVLRAERLVVAYPNDSAAHAQMVSLAHRLLAAGQLPLDHWYSLLTAGSPYFMQYQSATAILAGALGSVFGAANAYSWSLYLLLALWPLCVYWSGRLLGWSRWQAAIAAAISPLLTSVTGYGYEHESYVWIGSGLWSQLWAMWTLPLAWAFSWRYVSQRRNLFGAFALLALTITCHFLSAYLAALILVILVLLKPSDALRRAGRAAIVGGLAVLATLWVTIPLLADGKWVAADEFQIGTFWDDSYGARKVLGWLVSGQIYDSGRFPVVTILVGVGLAVCLVAFRRDERARGLVCVWALSLLLFFGRPTLGPVLNVLPGNQSLYFPRFLVGLHLAGLFLAGVGSVWLLRLVESGIRRAARGQRWAASATPRAVAVGALGAVVVVTLALAPAWSQISSYDAFSASGISFQQSLDATAGNQILSLVAVAERRGGGRVYAGLPTNWGRSFLIGEVPVYIFLTNADVDSIGFSLRTLSLMSGPEAYFDDTNIGDYPLFGIHYLLTPDTKAPPVHATFLARSGPYRLWSVGAPSIVRVVDTQGSITADRTNVGAQTAGFLHSAQPATNVLPTIAFAGAPPAPGTLPPGVPPAGPPGRVDFVHDDLIDGQASSVVTANRVSVVLLAASYDPGWTATVDGVPVVPQMVAPALVGVEVAPGTHQVDFRYVGYSSYPLLFAAALLTVVAAGALAWRRRPSSGPERDAGQREPVAPS